MVAIFKPNLRLGFGYDQLGEAIACRSLTRVNHILQEMKSGTERFEGNPSLRLSPVELAIGWPNGLQRLLDVGFCADFGLRLSISMNDLRSTEMILASENFPTEKDAWVTVLRALGGSCQQIEEVVIKSFARRRQALAALAIKELPEEVLFRLGVSNEKPLDRAALEVYQELQKRSVNVPQSLKPASSDPFDGFTYLTCLDSSIYNALFVKYQLPSRRLLDSLYTNGFELVDPLDAQGRTPLPLAFRHFYCLYWDGEMIQLIHWLLDKGACPEFPCGDSYPNVLFYTATYWSKVIKKCPQPLTRDLECLIRRSALLCNPLCPDDCQCYCSSAGCLPFYNIWNCDAIIYDSHEHCKSISSDTLFGFLENWLSLCSLDEGLSELCYKEAFRLEVFDRLGMGHTCCGHRGAPVDDNDRKQLQDEDSELKEQLDLIIQVYQNRRNKHSGRWRGFWESLMQDLDGILPDLIPEERCKYHCKSGWKYHHSAEYTKRERELHDLRTAKEKEALAKRNYLGLDFIDVIRLHFADSPDSGSSDSDGNSATASNC